jgi:hypothetical protein
VVRLLATVAAIDPDFHTFLALAVSTAARRSQLGALRWGDVDLVQGQIGFVRALLDAKGGPVLRPRRLDGPIGSTWTATASSCSSLTTRERDGAPTAPA